MKEVFKKCMNAQIVEPFLVGIFSMLILEFVVYPGLTIPNTIFNLLSGAIGVGLIIFIVNYVRLRYLVKDNLYSESCDTEVESGETELDYINPEEIKPTSKKVVKKKDSITQTKPKMSAKKPK